MKSWNWLSMRGLLSCLLPETIIANAGMTRPVTSPIPYGLRILLIMFFASGRSTGMIQTLIPRLLIPIPAAVLGSGHVITRSLIALRPVMERFCKVTCICHGGARAVLRRK